MRFISALVLAVAGLTAAQSSTSAAAPATSSSAASSGCGSAIDALIAACLQNTTPLLNRCGPRDWTCLCRETTQIVVCYNYCPSDPNAFGAKQKKETYCNDARVYGSSSSTPATTGKHGATTVATSPIAATSSSSTKTTNAVHSGFASASGSGSAASASASAGGAASCLNPAGGLLAAAFGLALL